MKHKGPAVPVPMELVLLSEGNRRIGRGSFDKRSPSEGDRGFESRSLQRGVRCEPAGHPLKAAGQNRGHGRQRWPQSADSEGGSPEEVCTDKEIRDAQVNVLSMCRRAGTAARALDDPVARVSNRAESPPRSDFDVRGTYSGHPGTAG